MSLVATRPPQMTTLFILQGEGMNTQLGSIKVAPATVSGGQRRAGRACPIGAGQHLHAWCWAVGGPN